MKVLYRAMTIDEAEATLAEKKPIYSAKSTCKWFTPSLSHVIEIQRLGFKKSQNCDYFVILKFTVDSLDKFWQLNDNELMLRKQNKNDVKFLKVEELDYQDYAASYNVPVKGEIQYWERVQ